MQTSLVLLTLHRKRIKVKTIPAKRNLGSKAAHKKSAKGAAGKSDKKNDLIDNIDPKLAEQFKARSLELKEKVHKDKLEDKIRRHTNSPLKAAIPGIMGIFLVLIMITYFNSKGVKIDPDLIPRIDEKGGKGSNP